MVALVFLGLRLLFALALYAFVGWAIYTMWKNLEREALISKKRSIPVISLSIQIDDQVQRKSFTQPQLVIGRDASCEISIEDRTISSRHARLSFHHSQWWVEDLHSRNGTFLNQEKVVQAMALVSGDELQCGRVRIAVQIGNDFAQEKPSEGG